MVLISWPPSQRYHTMSHGRNFKRLFNVLTYTVQPPVSIGLLAHSIIEAKGMSSGGDGYTAHIKSPGQGNLPSLLAGPRPSTYSDLKD